MTNKIAIPAILVATVMVAGMFAFVPVEQASTVHTTLTQMITLTQDNTVDGADFTITCPASTSCQILDVYLIERNSGNDADIDTIQLTVDGADVLELAVDSDNPVVENDVQAVNNVSGVTMPASSTLVFDMGTDGSTDFGLIVVVASDGTGTASIS